MITRTSPIALGVTFYIFWILCLYGLRLLAFPNGSGPIPLWFTSLQTVLAAVLSVSPGVLVGWLSRERGFSLGAVTGAIGALIGYILTFYLFVGAAPLGGELQWRVAVGGLATMLAASITNAIGGVTGVALRRQLMPAGR
jgi:hypothetical protein